MTYALGIDLGTTFSAAAVHRDGRARIVELGTRSASIPSVVFLRDDETVLAGEAAHRRAASEPHRVAREFKRRLGDTTPVLLGGAAYSAEALTARLLRWIVDQVTDREGGPPSSIAITHPANWGPYKIDLVHQAVRLAELDGAELITEPEAAARHYASHERVDDDTVVAVYDLGGGTFDAAILRKSAGGFEPLGRPEGVERLGGIDFDAAVVGHVVRALDGGVEALDQNDPGTVQALTRLRQDCVDAKEGLSSDTDVSIPVLLPNIQTEVRLTRAEFEAMIRPALGDSLAAMRRAMESADITVEDVSVVLLVGGSSRIPLVTQLVSNEFGRPVAVDADPKHAVALGAALVAADRAAEVPGDAPSDLSGDADADLSGDAPSVLPGGAPAGGSAPEPQRAAPLGPVTEDPDPAPTAPMASAASSAPAEGSRSKVPVLVGAGLAAVAALVAGVVIIGASGGDSPQEAAASPITTSPITTSPATTSPIATSPAVTPTTLSDRATTTLAASEPAPTPTTEPATTTPAATTLVPATPCPIGPERTACITGISVDPDGGLVAPFVTVGYVPELEPVDDHVHFYFDSVVGDDERNAGSAGSGGDWRLWDAPDVFTASGGENGRPGYTVQDALTAGATKLCAIVADASHAVVVGTGNCIDLPAAAMADAITTGRRSGDDNEVQTALAGTCVDGAGPACGCGAHHAATPEQTNVPCPATV